MVELHWREKEEKNRRKKKRNTKNKEKIGDPPDGQSRADKILYGVGKLAGYHPVKRKFVGSVNSYK